MQHKGPAHNKLPTKQSFMLFNIERSMTSLEKKYVAKLGDMVIMG